MLSNITGFVFYRGPSMLDGAPIVAIATGLGKASRNSKTGHLIQTWIIRADQSPIEAINSGSDASICGDCQHRGAVVDGRNVNRSCYVTVFQAPLSVYKTLQRGRYPELAPHTGAELLRDATVRLGAYGDPAAVPFHVWQALLAFAGSHTGYTHQWRHYPELAAYCMASCDTAVERAQSKLLGWRTFRVRMAGDAVQAREVVCPASKEAGARTNCAACRACGGHTAKAKADIVIIAHGAAPKVNAFHRRAA